MKQKCRTGAHEWDTVAEANRCCSPSWRRAVRVLGDPTLDGDPRDLDAFGRVYMPVGRRMMLVLGWVAVGVRWRPRGHGVN